MKHRILVVDDEEKLRRVIELQLSTAGFDVDKAASAEEALKLAERADLVLTDLKLPGMDGLALRRGAEAAGRDPAAQHARAGCGHDGVRND